MKDNIYRFYKYNNNPNGSDYCFCQRPVDSNMSLCCFFENGEICGFMSETLVPGHSEIKEIDMNEFCETNYKKKYGTKRNYKKER